MAVHTDAQKQGDQAVLFRTETVAAGERRYYRDRSQILREVWMPGDGDGGSNYGRTRTDITNKWRFYQSPTDQQNPPPRNVILDDEAVYRIMEHHLATKKDRGEFWECDFTASKGTVLVDRPNRGRPAWLEKDSNVEATTINQRRQLVHSIPAGRQSHKQMPLTGDPRGYTAYLFGGEMQRDRLSATYLMPKPTIRNVVTQYNFGKPIVTSPEHDAKCPLEAIYISFDKSLYPAEESASKQQNPRGRKRGASQMLDEGEIY